MNLIGGALQGLGRILRPQQQPPGVTVSPEFDSQSVTPARIKQAGTDSPQTMPDRLPSVSAPQPDSPVAARIARDAGINTDPTITPRIGFDRSMNRAQGVPAPMPEEFQATRISQPAEGAPQPLNSTGQAIEPAQRVTSDTSVQSTTQPPPPPKLREIRPSTPMPQATKHGDPGDSNRGMHALKAFGREFIMSGLNPVAAAGAAAGTLIDPQGYHDVQHRRDINRWWPSAHAEMQAQEEENKGKIQQQQMDTGYYDREAKKEELGARRVERKNAADDRAVKIQTDRDEIKHRQAKDYVDEMVKTGQPIDPAQVKGTKFEGVGGKTLTTQQRDHLFHVTDAKTGEESVYNYDTGERQPIPGVTGRIQREPKDPDYQKPHVILNQATADKQRFEQMKNIHLPKARARTIEFQQIEKSLRQGQDVSISGLSPEAQAILQAVSGGSREDKIARVAAEAQKAKADADQLQSQMHVYLGDMQTKYGKHGQFFEVQDTGGDYPSVQLHPELLEGDDESAGSSPSPGKRTGLLDLPGKPNAKAPAKTAPGQPSRIRPPQKKTPPKTTSQLPAGAVET